MRLSWTLLVSEFFISRIGEDAIAVVRSALAGGAEFAVAPWDMELTGAHPTFEAANSRWDSVVDMIVDRICLDSLYGSDLQFGK
jgi:hypothetical protein